MLHYKQLQKASTKKDDENFRFRCFLKTIDGEEIDRYVHAYAKRNLTSDTCANCQNCCRTLDIVLMKPDIERIAQALDTSVDKVISTYTKFNQDKERILKKRPCPFMKVGECQIYEHRPTCCIQYPYLAKEDVVFRLAYILANAHVCPIVYQLLEDMKNDYAEEFSAYLDEYGAMIG